ncbi:MAG: UvrD-helicase domain-containing protein [Tenericutes bacterium]|nr:UvrD-helicase domain-containing protein [Mycoplasmatota bacterium]
MNYTPTQLKAIHDFGNNILVSAGAGSGKTGVLMQRVVEKLKKGNHIDELIILTFTKAAAFEMKSRIIDAINSEDSIKSELKRINNAIITTFDAFCLKLVKEYHYLLDLPSNISIGDKIQFMTMEKIILEETIQSYYESHDEVFDALVVEYFQKGDDLIYEVVSNLAKKVSKIPNYESIVDDFDALYFSDSVMEKHFEEFKSKIVAIRDNSYQNYKELVTVMSKYDKDSIVSYISALDNFYLDLMTSDFDYLLSFLMDTAFVRKPSIRNEEDIKEDLDYFHPLVKESIDQLRGIVKDLNITSKEIAINRVLSTKGNTLKILEITLDYLNRLKTKKKQANLYSYQDIMELATTLLVDNQDICDLYKSTIKEIMIDEYQDTNDLQVYFVSLISNNNLFMVGDIKQSIYGFRDANPQNFLDNYMKYQQGKDGQLINLRENFRSRKQILEDINKTFYHVMNDEIGGINYQDGQSLIYGLKSYDNEYPNQHYGIDFIKYDLESLKEEDELLNNSLVEANLLAEDIKAKIDSKYQIFDGAFRDISYKDIAILIDRKTNFQQISEILSKKNIPVNLYSDEPFIDSPEMLFLTNFLKFVHCFIDVDYLRANFRALFYSVTRSFVFKIKDQEIISFLANEQIENIRDLVRLDDYIVFSGLYNLVNELVSLTEELPVFELIQLIYRKLDIYKSISYLDNPRKKEEKLDYFAKTIQGFESFSFFDLIDYLDAIEENKDWDIEYSLQNSQIEAVSLMTMHKSKGLQFPVVYCPGLNKQFNYSENKDFFLFDLQYGLITNAFDQGFNHTFLRYLSLDKTKKEYISERIRLLYVAFTRAKENLVLFADYKDLETKDTKMVNGYVEDFLRLKYNKFTKVLATTEIADYDNHFTATSSENLVEADQISDSNICITRKYFNLHKKEIDESRFSKSEYSLFNDETINTIDYGNKVHKYLERLDFNNLDASLEKLPKNIKESYQSLLETEVFDFNLSPIIYQEYEFVDESNLYARHGIIDLMVEYNDIIYIVDYKLKSITDDAYKKQLRGYKNYIQKHTTKKVKCFLYSILSQIIQEIE